MLDVRHRCGLIGLFTVAVLVCAVRSSDGSWSAVGASTYLDSSKALAAGGVTGTVGVLTTLNHTNTATTCKTVGAVGASWAGSQYDHDDDYDSASIIVLHTYDRVSSGAATLTFSQQSTITVASTAHQWQTGTWWWNSDNHVEETVTAYATKLGSVIPTTITWSVHTEAKANGGDSGNELPHPGPHSSNNNNGTVPPSSTSQFNLTPPPVANGSSSGSMQLPDVPGARCEAMVSFWCTASGCVDNAVVTKDELKLSFTFESGV